MGQQMNSAWRCDSFAGNGKQLDHRVGQTNLYSVNIHIHSDPEL